jgi:hypothetical protein
MGMNLFANATADFGKAQPLGTPLADVPGRNGVKAGQQVSFVLADLLKC